MGIKNIECQEVSLRTNLKVLSKSSSPLWIRINLASLRKMRFRPLPTSSTERLVVTRNSTIRLSTRLSTSSTRTATARSLLTNSSPGSRHPLRREVSSLNELTPTEDIEQSI